MKQPRIVNERQVAVEDTEGVEHLCEYSYNAARQRGGLRTLSIKAPPGYMVVEAIGGMFGLVQVSVGSSALNDAPTPPQMY